ncbi:hypothetical protein [Streptosporangium sandarakinum]|uniref:hypothetical protein n=1 Tax=Streptosporangium sandarakinum TaxID=1260955 RepID=UPI003712FB9D
MNKLPRRHLRRLVAQAAILQMEADQYAAQLDATPRWKLRRRRVLRQQAHNSAIRASTARHILITVAADCFDPKDIERDADRVIGDYITWDKAQQADTHLAFGLHHF